MYEQFLEVAKVLRAAGSPLVFEKSEVTCFGVYEERRRHALTACLDTGTRSDRVDRCQVREGDWLTNAIESAWNFI